MQHLEVNTSFKAIAVRSAVAVNATKVFIGQVVLSAFKSYVLSFVSFCVIKWHLALTFTASDIK